MRCHCIFLRCIWVFNPLQSGKHMLQTAHPPCSRSLQQELAIFNALSTKTKYCNLTRQSQTENENCRHSSQPKSLNFYPTALFAEGVLAITHCSTFASPHEPTLKPKACKSASAFTTHFGKAILAIAKKQNKFVLRGYSSAN